MVGRRASVKRIVMIISGDSPASGAIHWITRNSLMPMTRLPAIRDSAKGSAVAMITKAAKTASAAIAAYCCFLGRILATLYPEKREEAEREIYGEPRKFTDEQCAVCYGSKMEVVEGKGARPCLNCKNERGTSTGKLPEGENENE